MATNTLQDLWAAQPIAGPLIVGALGGLMGVYIELRKHAKRKIEDKLSLLKYPFFVVFLFFALPLAGSFVVGMYLSFGDSFSAILAFQTGAIAPLILQGWATSQANRLTSDTVQTKTGQ